MPRGEAVGRSWGIRGKLNFAGKQARDDEGTADDFRKQSCVSERKSILKTAYEGIIWIDASSH